MTTASAEALAKAEQLTHIVRVMVLVFFILFIVDKDIDVTNCDLKIIITFTN